MSTIKCRTCSSTMTIDRCESSGKATTCWHQCPVCRQVRLTSTNRSASEAVTSQARSSLDYDNSVRDPEVAYGQTYFT